MQKQPRATDRPGRSNNETRSGQRFAVSGRMLRESASDRVRAIGALRRASPKHTSVGGAGRSRSIPCATRGHKSSEARADARPGPLHRQCEQSSFAFESDSVLQRIRSRPIPERLAESRYSPHSLTWQGEFHEQCHRTQNPSRSTLVHCPGRRRNSPTNHRKLRGQRGRADPRQRARRRNRLFGCERGWNRRFPIRHATIQTSRLELPVGSVRNTGRQARDLLPSASSPRLPAVKPRLQHVGDLLPP